MFLFGQPENKWMNTCQSFLSEPFRPLDASLVVTELYCQRPLQLSTQSTCMLDETMSGETMIRSAINKISNKLEFLYRKNRFSTPTLRGLLCNALIQPHFDYACSAWYPNLTKELQNRIQTSQNKYIRFSLKLDKMTHIAHRYLKL